ncbi:glycosyltransferase [Amycolatopsis panacis]|uniref:Glycosyltransferase n=1 Tax=Amycolatopsis panacis TaxID=2340917 RepID=A0A419I4T8_9PSEU|nr:glycosyltransferase [Amycolatopsis panacis]RJQ85478.1 glycosyltransferase [Amycolatopsis panacis]
MPGDSPQVRLECAATADGFATVLEGALELLADAGRIGLAGADEPADILHTVGDVPPLRYPRTARRVHTVDRVALGRRGLTAATGWARRQRRLTGDVVTWLVHGRTAGQVLVASGVVPGDRVHALPVMAPPRSAAGGGMHRSAARERLGIAPGVGLIVGCAPNRGQAVPGWPDAIRGTGRTDVAVITCPAGRPGEAGRQGEFSLADLLAAADLFVAAGLGLTACNPAAAAVAAGVRVIAAATDSAAELVRFGRTGLVVPPSPSAIAAAVTAGLDGVLPRTDGRAVPPGGESPARVLARGLLGAYRRAVVSPRPRLARSVR